MNLCQRLDMAWAIWFCKIQADFKICLPHKAVLEIYLVFVQSHDWQNTLDLQHPSWSLEGPRMCITIVRASGFLFISSAALEDLRTPGILTYWSL